MTILFLNKQSRFFLILNVKTSFTLCFLKKLVRGRKGGNFKICGDELILDVLELQMNGKKEGFRGRLPF